VSERESSFAIETALFKRHTGVCVCVCVCERERERERERVDY